MKQLNGMKDVYIQYHGEWSDPELIYKRGCFICRCNYYTAVDSLPDTVTEALFRSREFIIALIKHYGTWEKF